MALISTRFKRAKRSNRCVLMFPRTLISRRRATRPSCLPPRSKQECGQAFGSLWQQCLRRPWRIPSRAKPFPCLHRCHHISRSRRSCVPMPSISRARWPLRLLLRSKARRKLRTLVPEGACSRLVKDQRPASSAVWPREGCGELGAWSANGRYLHRVALRHSLPAVSKRPRALPTLARRSVTLCVRANHRFFAVVPRLTRRLVRNTKVHQARSAIGPRQR